MDNVNVFRIVAKLDLPLDANAPDSFNIDSQELPSHDFVVCRNKQGEAVSKYGDNIWDFTEYQLEGKPSRLQFIYWNEGEATPERYLLLEEIKHIFFILIWLREKNPLSIGTLKNYSAVLKVIANFAEHRKVSLKHIISNYTIILEFVRTQNSGWLIETFSSLLLLLANSSHKFLSIPVVGRDTIQLLQRQNKEYRQSLKQHPPIPMRIYSEFIFNILNYIDEWGKYSAEILDLLLSCHSIKTKSNGKRRTVEFKKKLDQASPEMKEYVVSQINNFSLKGIVSHVTDIQSICKIIVQAFTGMRDEEAQSLLYFCTQTITSNSQEHTLINGRTTKFSHGMATKVQWVTNKDGLKAILVAREIADSLYKIHKDIAKKEKSDQYPLFVSTSYYSFSGSLIQTTSTMYRIGSLYSKQGIKKLIPTIEHTDIEELEQIDPHRAWRSENNFQLGQQWSFTTHQLRRSLALYAQSSGLVSLPSLRRQLQHITNEMTRYYAKGSAFARNLLDMDKKHFAQEWQQTQLESASLSYIFNVLMSNEPLYGGHVHWVKNTLKDSDGSILVDRKKTLQSFKNGELAYRETILGGCTSIESCSYSSINWLKINCLKENCRHLIVSLSKLEKAIVAQENMINFLDKETLEYRTELSHLDILKNTRSKIFETRECSDHV